MAYVISPLCRLHELVALLSPYCVSGFECLLSPELQQHSLVGACSVGFQHLFCRLIYSALLSESFVEIGEDGFQGIVGVHN